MASPFPGMDPYLEGDMWQEFHETPASALRAQLMPRLKPKYVALLAKRSLIAPPTLSLTDMPARMVYPDVHVVAPPEALARARHNDSATAVAEPAVALRNVLAEGVPQLSIEIRDIAQRLLVTVIKILSPINKRGVGAIAYEARRNAYLKTRTHLLEIDLSRRGSRIECEEEEPPAAPYYIYLSRWQRYPMTQIWPLPLRLPLPVVPVPLFPEDADVPLDMQAAVQASFALVGYEQLLDYSKPPPAPALAAEDGVWAESLLRTAGYRHTPEER